jgi:hypothetical protein
MGGSSSVGLIRHGLGNKRQQRSNCIEMKSREHAFLKAGVFFMAECPPRVKTEGGAKELDLPKAVRIDSFLLELFRIEG